MGGFNDGERIMAMEVPGVIIVIIFFKKNFQQETQKVTKYSINTLQKHLIKIIGSSS